MTTEEKILNTSPSNELIQAVEAKENRGGSHDFRKQAVKEMGFTVPNSNAAYSINTIHAFQSSKYKRLFDHVRTAIDKDNDNFVIMTMPYHEITNEEKARFDVIHDNRWTVHGRGFPETNCYFIILPLNKARSIGSKWSYHKKSADEIIEEVLG